ncbi:MAG TPA: hypothetical protein VNH44_11290 [Micropepsaceae bacterium]|nr:hypothetical protein [Micropepsaceae bacterium]
MMVSKEMVMAFVDGELSSADALRVEREIATNPALARYVDEQRALKRHLETAFSPIVTAPVPHRLEATVMDTPIISNETAQAPHASVRPLPFWRIGFPIGALAAGIAIGVLAMNSMIGANLIANRNGGFVAAGGLAQALSTQLASEQASPASPTRIGVSFVNKGGEFCRSFTSDTGRNAAVAGIACRTAQDWRIEALAAMPAQDSRNFQPAAATMPDSVRTALNGIIAGAALDAQAEREARDRDWRAR